MCVCVCVCVRVCVRARACVRACVRAWQIAELARRRFANDKQVEILTGDSVKLLPEVMCACAGVGVCVAGCARACVPQKDT